MSTCGQKRNIKGFEQENPTIKGVFGESEDKPKWPGARNARVSARRGWRGGAGARSLLLLGCLWQLQAKLPKSPLTQWASDSAPAAGPHPSGSLWPGNPTPTTNAQQ